MLRRIGYGTRGDHDASWRLVPLHCAKGQVYEVERGEDLGIDDLIAFPG
jgi:hypothetical protein